MNGGTSGDTGGRPGLDVNKYATKKTIAQGMLDIALLTANASQLKYVLTVGHSHQFYTILVTLISVSIALQILAGIAILFVGNININKKENHRLGDILNNITTGLIFLISFINVIISSLGMEASTVYLPPVVAV